MTRNYGRRRRGLYRSRSGLILGVCKGFAEYFNVSVRWTRILTVVSMIFTGFWPGVAIYLIAALLMKPGPVLPLETDQEEEFYNSYAASRAMALRRLKRNFDNMDRRIQRMENVVTAREYNWEQRLNSR